MLQQEDGGWTQQPGNKTGRSSWAVEVEEEHEATGWKGLPKESSSRYSSNALPTDEWEKKSKNKKKKKNARIKDNLAASKTESDRDKCVQQITGLHIVEAIPAFQGGKSEGGMNKVSDNRLLSTGNHFVSNDSGKQDLEDDVAKDEVWEVAGSHKFRRNEDTHRTQMNGSNASSGAGMVANHCPRPGQSFASHLKADVPSHGRAVAGNRSQEWRSPELGTEWIRRPENLGSGSLWPKAPTGISSGEEKWETVTKNKGKAHSFLPKGGKIDTRFTKNETWGDKMLDTDDVSASMSQAGPMNGLKGPVTTIETKPQSVHQPLVSIWQRGGNPSEAKASPASFEGNNTNSSFANPQIMSTLLPIEKQGEIGQFLHSPSNAAFCHKEREAYFEQADAALVLDDFPSSVHSDSACSDDELESDSDWVGSEEFDSEASDVSLETKKRNKWFRLFFETMDGLTNDQMNEHDRQWHCPACKGGVGAIDWYRGLQPLLAHAKTVRSKRVKLHRNFAKVLEEELLRRGTGSGPAGEGMFGKWKGLREDDETTNPWIVWPPMVIIQNTKLELDEQEKWIGMGNKELLDLFKDYNVMKARHAYGPQGHRGMSILVFADSPPGYMDAQRLDKHFKDARRGKDNWDHPGKIMFHPGGNRILYGYMATSEDMEIFNKHSGKSKLKWAMKRLYEAVVEPMRRMDEENHQLNLLKVKVQKQKEHSKALEKTVSLVTKRLRLRDQEIKVIRIRALEQYEENQKEMDYLEQTYKERINQLANESTKREEELQEKEELFKQEQIKRCQQLERTRAKIPKNKTLGEDQQQQQQLKMEEEIARQSELVETSIKDSEDYESQKRELMRKHHLRKLEVMRKQYEAALLLEKEFEEERAQLRERYKHQREEAGSKVMQESFDNAA